MTPTLGPGGIERMVQAGDPTRLKNSILTKKNYFTSSDPHHDMLGGGCQVGVVI